MSENNNKSAAKGELTASSKLTIDDALQSIREIADKIEKLVLEKEDPTPLK